MRPEEADHHDGETRRHDARADRDDRAGRPGEDRGIDGRLPPRHYHTYVWDQPRQRLIDATRRCIARQGLAATTSRDISAGAEANLAAITYHFGSKDELVAEALLEALRDWLKPALDVLGGGG